MTINLWNEKLLTLDQVVNLLPPRRDGKPLQVASVYRWIHEGVRASDGRVRLEAVRCAGRWLTSKEALQRFVDAQTRRQPDEKAR